MANDFVNERRIIIFRVAKVCAGKECFTKSTYASSSTTSASTRSASSIICATSFLMRYWPVGLFGLQRNSTSSGFISAIINSGLIRRSGISIRFIFAPIIFAATAYSPYVYCGMSARSFMNARVTSWMSSEAPAPTSTSPVSQPNFCDILALNSLHSVSGYNFIASIAPFIASRTNSGGP
uniref:Uncharacterized protein n=1 Tax=Candidatus Methanophaga sp. ANME-1 ERB7 TaxID=2759913 RepID=A0A7G9Z809_9EURY|nr:hypothetical protein JCABFCCD_00034 [Methanosarcinales archaeon ANME-1 ERB7]